MCCLISVFNWFVIVLTFVVLLLALERRGTGKKSGNGLAEGCFTDVALHSSERYHQEPTFATTSDT